MKKIYKKGYKNEMECFIKINDYWVKYLKAARRILHVFFGKLLARILLSLTLSRDSKKEKYLLHI